MQEKESHRRRSCASYAHIDSPRLCIVKWKKGALFSWLIRCCTCRRSSSSGNSGRENLMYWMYFSFGIFFFFSSCWSLLETRCSSVQFCWEIPFKYCITQQRDAKKLGKSGNYMTSPFFSCVCVRRQGFSSNPSYVCVLRSFKLTKGNLISSSSPGTRTTPERRAERRLRLANLITISSFAHSPTRTFFCFFFSCINL